MAPWPWRSRSGASSRPRYASRTPRRRWPARSGARSPRCPRAPRWTARSDESARLALLEPLEQPLGLLEVAPRVHVVRIDVEDDLPLRDGLGQLLLAEETDAFLVVAVDDLASRLGQEPGDVLVVGLQLRELGESPEGVVVLLVVQRRLPLPVEREL